MAGKRNWRRSKSTTVIQVRMPNEDVEVLDRRVANYPGEMFRSSYIAMRMHYDLHRKHKKHKGAKK
jgi:hypothetical protein